VNRRRVELMDEDPQTAPQRGGALVIDETGDRKAGKATAHLGKQYLGGIGKIDNGVVSVSSVAMPRRGSTIRWRSNPTPRPTTSRVVTRTRSSLPNPRDSP
jgi:DDE superfamily endonuclease